MDSMTRVAVITGGGTGIGRAVALALAGTGYSVVVAGRRKEPLEATAAEGSKMGARMLSVPTDGGRPKVCQGSVRQDGGDVRAPGSPFQQCGLWSSTCVP